MGENICTTSATRLISKKYKALTKFNDKKSSCTTGREAEQIYFQRWHTADQQIYEKVLILTVYQENEIENHLTPVSSLYQKLTNNRCTNSLLLLVKIIIRFSL